MTSRQMKCNRLWAVAAMVAVVVLAAGLVAGCGGGGGSPSQDFLVGTWEGYALSDSYSGEKVPVEEAGIYTTVTVSADGTWTAFTSAPGVPPEYRAGTWEKVGDNYITRVPGEPDDMLYREGSQVYEVYDVPGVGVVWFWYRKA